MTVRFRLMLVTVLALVATMSVWGWIQLRTLENLLFEQQGKRLSGVAETIGTYYQHFPTGQGLSALDTALKEHIQSDVRLARIDLFSLGKGSIEYIAGASRVHYEWPDSLVASAVMKMKPEMNRLSTDGGPALGLLYPFVSDGDVLTIVGVIAFSRANWEILSRAQYLMVFSTGGLLMAILLVLGLSYGWLIGRPLRLIIRAIDAFQSGRYVHRIPLDRRGDEWGQVSDHFNRMAEEVERVLAGNRDLNRHLEQRVQEATSRVIELQMQVNQLQQLIALGYLTATLAHDLGTPLHSIAGMTKLLLERKDWPADAVRKLELILHQTERLNNVIRNVRRATRLPEAHFEALTVSDILQESLPLVEPLISKAGIRLDLQIEPSLPVIYVDRYRFQTVLLNLLQNSVEAMPAGGHILISAQKHEAEQSVVLAVSDDGKGIPPELIGKVCEPFFSTHAEEGMRGLGLAIVQDIVKIHGGSMKIDSRLSGGTTVTLSLPVGHQNPENGD